jgi:Glycosyl hydrolases family 28
MVAAGAGAGQPRRIEEVNGVTRWWAPVLRTRVTVIVALLALIAATAVLIVHGRGGSPGDTGVTTQPGGSAGVTPTPLATLPGAASTATAGPIGPGAVIAYDRTPGTVDDTAYTLTVNGQRIAVDQFGDAAYARFAMSGTVHVTVGTQQPVSGFSISPRSYNINGAASGNNLTFDLGKPAGLIVTVNGPHRLLIMADAPETNAPTASAPGVVNLATYVTDKTGTSPQTAQIQAAINAASAKHATLYVPDGEYLTGSLQLRSNMTLYLQSGARIQGSPNPSDYTSGALIRTSGASNLRVAGHGIIDTDGTALRPAGSKTKLFRVEGGQNVMLGDVLLRDSASWTVHIEGASHVTVSNLHVVNNLNLGAGLDGIDPDSSTDVTISGAFVYTFDDCFAVKTTSSGGGPTDNVRVEGSVCWTHKSALKIGTESTHTISNVVFAANDVVHADRALAVYVSNGGNLGSVTYSGDFSETVGGDAKQKLIEIDVSAGQAMPIAVTDYTAYSPSPSDSTVRGSAADPITVVFTNLNIAGVHVTSLGAAHLTTRDASARFN